MLNSLLVPSLPHHATAALLLLCLCCASSADANTKAAPTKAQNEVTGRQGAQAAVLLTVCTVPSLQFDGQLEDYETSDEDETDRPLNQTASQLWARGNWEPDEDS